MIPGLGKRITQAREGAGLSLSALARAIGISRHSLILIEDGRTANPNVGYIRNVAEVCGVSTDWLVGLDDRMQRETTVR
jgi:transcriptional regulator with XRE-family HTH domain